jgi:hypothetical protein
MKGKVQGEDLSKECIRAAELYLLELARKGIAIKGAKMLATYFLRKETFSGRNTNSYQLTPESATRSHKWTAQRFCQYLTASIK